MRRITYPIRSTAKHKDKRKRRGQALVESALVLMVVLMMLAGTFDLAQVFFVHQSLAERARKTARYASMNYEAPQEAENYFLYGTPNAPGIYASTFLSVEPSMVDVTRLNSDTNSDRMEVKVHDYPYSFVTPFLSGAYTGKSILATAPTESRNGW